MEIRLFAAPGLALALTFAAHVAGAEPASTASSAPGNAAPIAYRSAFENYRPFRDEPMVSWQETNRALGALGGHMGHLRGSTGRGSMAKDFDDAPTMRSSEKPMVPGKPAAPMPADHSGHGGMAPQTSPQ